MKKLFLVSLVVLGLASIAVAELIHTPDERDLLQSEHGHAHVFTPEEEKRFLEEVDQGLHILSFRFAQTRWLECSDMVTGNYLNYSCTNRRGMAQILHRFMDNHIFECVNEGLERIGESYAREVHIVHAGIFGDPRHSRRSLHSENRAIDIKAFRVELDDGRHRTFRIEDRENRPFLTGFRTCWGRSLRDYNECPLYNGQKLLTGTIGWEDRNHQDHMHTSVPYCMNGRYRGIYFRR